MLKRRLALLGSVSASALLLAVDARADDFTIVAGPPVTTTQTLNTTGNTGTVEAGGTINTTAEVGIVATADGVTVDNAGTVTGAGSGGVGFGIVLLNNNTITNSGTVAGNGVAIIAGANNVISNSGSLSGSYGIVTQGDDNEITNSGTAEGLRYGIYAEGDDITITNSGTATTGIFGNSGIGIYAGGSNITITNSGTAEGYFDGIGAYGSNITITNSGTAEGVLHGIGAYGDIRTYGSNITITNSGTAEGVFHGIFAYGDIRAYGSNITITNSGTATGRESGIYAEGYDITITNSGTVTGADFGIIIQSNIAITNLDSGIVTASNGTGISAVSNNTITNSGAVTGLFLGIDAAGDNNMITNSGTVTGRESGILAGGSNNTITNSGTATGSVFGIRDDGVYTTITNSGTTTGVRMNGSFGTLRNSGTVTASAGADALSTGDAAIGTVVVNTGIIDGRVALAASFDNSGWLGVTAPGAVTAHQISGTYVQTAQGTLGLHVGATTNDTLQADIARLDGTLATTFTGETFQRSYTLLTASQEITGAFATYTPVGLPGLFAGSLSYGPTSVTLTLVADVTPIAGLTPNELAVGTSLAGVINAYGGPVLGGLPDALSPLYALDASQLPQALDALSGESYASEQSILLNDGLYSRLTLLGRLRQGAYAGQGDALALLSNGGPTLSASTKGTDLSFGTQATTTWAQAFGSRTELDGETDTSDVSSSFGGLMTGADTQVEAWRVGAAIGYTQSSTTVDDLSSSSDVDSLMAALYAGTDSGPWSVRLGATYASNQTASSRTIAYPGFAEQASADYNSATTQLFAEVAYGLVIGTAAVEPFAGLAWINVDTDSFAETGSTAGLSVSSSSSSVTYGTLGVRAATSVVTSGGMVLQPRGVLAWQTASGDLSPSAQMAFLSAPNAGFTVGGAPLADNAALIEIGADLLISDQAQLGLSYVGQYADGVSSYGLQAAMTWTF